MRSTPLLELDYADETQDRTHSRRALFRRLRGSGAALAAFWGVSHAARARASSPDVSADVDPGALTAKLVRRLTLGLNEFELNQANTLGYSGYLEQQLNPAALDDSAVDAMLANLTTLTMTPAQLI